MDRTLEEVAKDGCQTLTSPFFAMVMTADPGAAVGCGGPWSVATAMRHSGRTASARVASATTGDLCATHDPACRTVSGVPALGWALAAMV